MFDSQAKANNAPIEFKSHSSDLIAVVNVLTTHIMGHDRENPILIKWISDLQRVAEHAGSGDHDPNAPSFSKWQPKKTEKHVYDDNLAAAQAEKKQKKKEDQDTREKAIK